MIGLLQQSTLCLIVTTLQVVQHITSHYLVCSCTNYLDMKSAQMTKKRIPALMISQRWTKQEDVPQHVQKWIWISFFLWLCPVHEHSYGSHLISGGEGRKDPFCSLFNIAKPCQSIYIMTLHVSCQSTASIGSQNYSNLPDSGMICSIS